MKRESIHCLPHDIVHEIFLLCRPFRSDEDAEISPRHPSVVLSHVCSSWRQAALGMPLLWVDIVAANPSSYPSEYELHRKYGHKWDQTRILWVYKLDEQAWIQNMKRRTAMLKAWISRSAACPLTITFVSRLGHEAAQSEGYEGLTDEANSVLVKYIDTICSSSTRWKAADICVVASELAPALCRITRLSPKRLPLLEKLTFRMVFCDDEALEHFGDARIFHATSLRSLCLHGMREIWDVVSGYHIGFINWSNLKSLSLLGYHKDDWAWNEWDGEPEETFGSSQALTVLKRCPNLVSCSLVLDDPEPDDSDSDDSSQHSSEFDPIPLLHLQSLSVEGISSHGKFLPKSFQLPSLQTLSLHRSTAQDEDEDLDLAIIEEPYLEWIEHLGDQLTDVNLDCFSISPETLHSILQHLPNVVRLKLSATPFVMTHTIQAHLTKPIDSEFLCPKLESIELSVDDKESPDGTCECLQCTNIHALDPITSDHRSACEQAVVDFLEARRGVGSSGHSHDSTLARIKSATIRCNFEKTIDIRKELEGRGVEMDGWELIVEYNAGTNKEKKSDHN